MPFIPRTRCSAINIERSPDAVQRAASAKRCTAVPGSSRTLQRGRGAWDGPGSAAHHFVLRCARETRMEAALRPRNNCSDVPRTRCSAQRQRSGAPLFRGLHELCRGDAEPVTVPGRQRTTSCCAAPGKRGWRLRCARETIAVTFPGRGAARSVSGAVHRCSGVCARGARTKSAEPVTVPGRQRTTSCCAAPGKRGWRLRCARETEHENQSGRAMGPAALISFVITSVERVVQAGAHHAKALLELN